MNIQNIEDVVGNLNDYLMEASGKDDCPLFELSTNSYAVIIKFLGLVIWSSENEEREWIESANDYEPLDKFLMKEADELIDSLQKMKFEHRYITEAIEEGRFEINKGYSNGENTVYLVKYFEDKQIFNAVMIEDNDVKVGTISVSKLVKDNYVPYSGKVNLLNGATLTF